jgi:glucans biosynthesis protein
VQTRHGHGYQKTPDGTVKLLLEFDGPALRALAPQTHVTGEASAVANAEIVERNAYRNDVTGLWRLALRVRRLDPAQPVELRAFLRTDSHTLSETWSYLLPPD